MQENSIQIKYGTQQTKNVVEIQAYVHQLEHTNYQFRKQIRGMKQLSEQKEYMSKKYEEMSIHLQQVMTELAYYQAMSITKNNGRPGKLSTQEIYEIRELRQRGKTLQKIAEQYQVLVTLVYKITKDINQDNRKKKENNVIE